MRIIAEPEAALRCVRLDSLTAIYHRRSGQTHLVAAPVPEILEALAGTPLDSMALLERLGVEGNAAARAALDERLNELSDCGLIARL